MRRILLNLAENAALFDGHVPEKLRQPWHLTTPDIAAMDEDSSLTLSTVGKRLEQVFDLSPAQCSYAARKQVRCIKHHTMLDFYHSSCECILELEHCLYVCNAIIWT